METLAPPLECLLDVRAHIENGEPVRNAILKYVNSREDSFSVQIFRWIEALETGSGAAEVLAEIESAYRRTLLSIFQKGIEGHSILKQLDELEAELLEIGAREIQEFVLLLPLKLLLPLLFFQFPAYLILMIGPLLRRLLEAI